MSMIVDVAAFAPHPDDVELFCGGTLITLADKGYKTAVIDCTEGELATSGTPETRAVEAANASAEMGLVHRENLKIPDGKINPLSGADELDSSKDTQLHRAVSAIRRLQPKIVMIPHQEGRHPDHSAASTLIERAVFFAGLKQFKTDDGVERHVPTQLLYYFMRFCGKPSFVVDTSSAHQRKVSAISAYKSQITPPKNGAGSETLINSPRTISTIDARDQFYGAMIGVEYGEPFVIKNCLAISDPVGHFNQNSTAKALLFPGAL
ncbi:MAG: bacillithiol biosynthesis deacetylase BshB1 [Bdellovibrionales bacterium]|nr:bacillithiol biosynthesis deacetylase BshB1 [Bdellovibrionales bacterium]